MPILPQKHQKQAKLTEPTEDSGKKPKAHSKQSTTESRKDHLK